jgi:hypothetical protein
MPGYFESLLQSKAASDVMGVSSSMAVDGFKKNGHVD